MRNSPEQFRTIRVNLSMLLCLTPRSLMSTTVVSQCFYLHLFNQLWKLKYAFNIETLIFVVT